MKKIIFIIIVLLLITIGFYVYSNEAYNSSTSDKLLSTENSITIKLPSLIMRGIGDTSTDPISINGNVVSNVSSKRWIPKDENLPLVLQLISRENKVEVTLLSRKKHSPFFSIPANTWCDKHGYLLKISDQLHHTLVKSRLIVSCKHNNDKGIAF